MIWWLSFADEDGFLGGVLIRADSFIDAVSKSHELKLNPGGEVQGVQLPGDADPPDHELNRLYAKADLEAELGGAVRMSDAFPDDDEQAAREFDVPPRE